MVEDGVTGLLVPFEPSDDGSREPVDPAALRRTRSPSGSTRCSPNPQRAAALGRAGRARAVEQFSWPAVAEQVVELYRRLLAAASD